LSVVTGTVDGDDSRAAAAPEPLSAVAESDGFGGVVAAPVTRPDVVADCPDETADETGGVDRGPGVRVRADGGDAELGGGVDPCDGCDVELGGGEANDGNGVPARGEVVVIGSLVAGGTAGEGPAGAGDAAPAVDGAMLGPGAGAPVEAAGDTPAGVGVDETADAGP
jgi:hypothetical protein